MGRSSAAVAAVVLIGTALARAAAAAPAPGDDAPSVRLAWTAPAECIDGAALAAAVGGQLGRPAFAPGADAELVARERVEISDSGRHRAEVVAIDAVLRLGRRADATTRARTFEAAHAGSLHARRIKRLMGN